MLQLLTCLSLALPSPVPAGERPGPDPLEFEFTELAPGVWAGQRPDPIRRPVMGNTLFAVTDEGVVVFDGGGLPVMAERLLAKIASVTDQPVTHVGISHWHGDHNFGIWPILERYPEAEVIAHSFTRDALVGSPAAYIYKYPTYISGIRESVRVGVEEGLDSEGNVLAEDDRSRLADFHEHIDLLDREYSRARLTIPTVTFEERLVLHRGSRTIEFLFLGAGNTAGDMLMWLPEERIVATGDLVVHPVPYLYNVPPRAWSATLRRLNALEYTTLVPGHGELLRDTAYVDLLIELSDSIADQRDALLELGLARAEVPEQLDFSEFEQRFTGGDEYLASLFDVWSRQPFRLAAMKALTGEPMVIVAPRPMQK